MGSAGIAELKAGFSEYLARVKAGEELLVTEHGRPIARIVPLSAAETPGVEELMRAGILRGPDRPLGDDFFRLPRPRDANASVRATLAAERAGREDDGDDEDDRDNEDTAPGGFAR
jgi:prevent-host-death family protein